MASVGLPRTIILADTLENRRNSTWILLPCWRTVRSQLHLLSHMMAPFCPCSPSVLSKRTSRVSSRQSALACDEAKTAIVASANRRQKSPERRGQVLAYANRLDF